MALEFIGSLGSLYPELASEMGLREFDSHALLVNAESEGKEEAFFKDWSVKLDKRIASEPNVEVRADAEILKDWMAIQLKGIEVSRANSEVEFLPGARVVYQGLLTLVNPRSPIERRKAAVDRFKLYVYGDKNHRPLLEAIQQATEDKIKRLHGQKILWPSRDEVERYLKDADSYSRAIRELLTQSEREDWNYEVIIFGNQLKNYHSFLRQTILPNARTDSRMPIHSYAQMARGMGVDIELQLLVEQATAAYRELYADFKQQAVVLAKKHGLKRNDPVAVMRHVRNRSQSKALDIETVYSSAVDRLEKILKKNDLVSLPAEPVHIRVDKELDSPMPLPYLNPPPLLRNQGESPEFILPSSTPSKDFSDFSSPLLAMVISAHEARPGHDLQFRSFLNNGVSVIRSRYAANTVNLEGWALYAEEMMIPYLELEEKLMATQIRLWRIARGFLEPQLHSGKIDARGVRQVLVNELGFSEAFGELELRRYNSQEVGVAPAYFYGYELLRQIRTAVEKKQGKPFSAKCFNDKFLSYGLLPLRQIQKRMMDPDFQCIGTSPAN